MPIPENEITARPIAGLYFQTRSQTRFWGWSSRGWAKLQTVAAQPPVQNLAEWLRQAHARLDRPDAGEKLAPPALEHAPRQPLGNHRKLQFVCSRHRIGLLIR